MTYLRITLLFACISVVGCAGARQLLPNPNSSLNRTAAELAADSAKRFPYKADAPQGGKAVGRAQVGYSFNTIEIENLGTEDWDDVEIWVNRSYVVCLPKLKARPEKIDRIPFQAIFDNNGHYFPVDNSKTLVNTLEVYYGGKMYDVKVQLAD